MQKRGLWPNGQGVSNICCLLLLCSSPAQRANFERSNERGGAAAGGAAASRDILLGMAPGTHLVILSVRRSRLRDGGEWGRKGRLKAGSGLCELGSSSRWPPWRRCFGVQQDGGDALLIALVFIGAIEAGVLMESIMVRAAGAADIFSNDSDRGLGGLYGQDHRPLLVSSAELRLACSFVAWFAVLMCPPRP